VEDDLTGTILDGRYQVLERVAEGAMGVVYRAERVKLGRIVAIKVLHEVLPNEMSARKRFEIEARAMAKLEHPHCASVLDVGIHDDRPYVVMDFVQGQDLQELIANGPVPIPRATEIVRQVLSGLAHAHEHGIIHRDVKPANIVLSQKTGLGDHVKILDFGLARLHDTGQNLTTGIVVGTPAYMAPEQIRGLRFDHRVDLYACGVLLFELLTGHKPFHSKRDDPLEVCKMHLTDPIPRLSAKLAGVDFGELEAVVARALAKDSGDRYASAQEYAAALDAAAPRRPSIPLGGSTPWSPSSSPSPAAPPSESLQITSADVMPVEDVHHPPSFEARSADVVSAILPHGIDPKDPASEPGASLLPHAGAETERSPEPRGVPETPDQHREGTAEADGSAPSAPAGSVAGDVPGPSPEPPERREASQVGSTAPAPATFLGIAVTPPGASPRAPSLGGAPEPPGTAATWLVKRRKAIAIGGVAAVALLAAVVVIASRRGAPASDGTGVASGSAVANGSADHPDPGREVVARANDLVVQGDKDAALDLLARSRRQYPASAILPFTAGRIYFSRFYWTEGLRSFRDAIRIDPTYRTDPELIKTVLRGFLTTPSYNSDLASFLREEIGSAAQPFLEETARDHPNATIRSRAASELHRYR
jgi:serine/threonine protein kinase